MCTFRASRYRSASFFHHYCRLYATMASFKFVHVLGAACFLGQLQFSQDKLLDAAVDLLLGLFWA